MVCYTFGQGCEYNMFADFLKLFEVLDMDDSFPISCSMWYLDSWLIS
jgi:hypothetical protein